KRILPRKPVWPLCALVSLISACFASASIEAENAATGESKFTLKALSLPGAAGTVSLDYFAYDPRNQLLWVPASNTGRVAIVDVHTDEVRSIDAFHTLEVNFKGKRAVMGPSSVALGDGAVYVGNRGDSTVCVVNTSKLTIGECVPTASPAEGM